MIKWKQWSNGVMVLWSNGAMKFCGDGEMGEWKNEEK